MRLKTNPRRIAQDVSSVNRSIRRWAEISGRGIARETELSARRVAANLAFRTQPFGNSERSQALGQVAVRRDIYRVFSTPGMLFEVIEKEKNKPGLAAHFYKLAREGRVAPVRKLLTSLGISVVIAQTPKQSLHKGRRNSRGRVRRGSPEQLVLGGKNGDALERYANKVQKRVGWAASGWSACAATLGSTRGIVKWKKRGRKGPGYVLRTGGDKKPTIYLINTAPYISMLLPRGEQEKALKREEGTLEKQCRMVPFKEARRSGLRVA